MFRLEPGQRWSRIHIFGARTEKITRLDYYTAAAVTVQTPKHHHTGHMQRAVSHLIILFV